MRVAIVHPWFLASGGAEKTVNVLAEIYPDADIFTLLYEEGCLPPNLRGRRILSPKLHWLPAKFKLYRYFLFLYPLAFESLDLTGYDVVLTSDSCVAKCVLTDQKTIHVCYCYSPMRCLYDQFRQFTRRFSPLIRPIFTLATHYVRVMDFVAAQRVTAFVADSYHIAERVRACYQRESAMIYPPVETSRGFISPVRGNYYLSVGRLTPDKHVDLLIQTCNELGRDLVIVGGGRERERLMRMAGPTIRFHGHVSDEELSKIYAECRAFLFPAEEDFGIVPVEAQSYGRPVIALGKGGTLETVVNGVTGVYFDSQTVESLKDTILRFETIEDRFDPVVIQNHSRTFDTQVFKTEISGLVDSLVAARMSGKTSAVLTLATMAARG